MFAKLSDVWRKSRGSVVIVVFVVLVLAALVIISTTDDQRDIRRLNLLKNGISLMHNPLFKAVSQGITIKSRAAAGKETTGFAVSPLWVEMVMLLLSAGTADHVLAEINRGTHFFNDTRGKCRAMKVLLNALPASREYLKLQSITKLYVRHDLHIKEWFASRAKNTLNMDIEYIGFDNLTEDRKTINKWVEANVLGKTTELFHESAFVPNATTMVLINTVYFKSKWLYAPTVLNGTAEFPIGNGTETSPLTMFKMNGPMLYAALPEWDAVAVDIPHYSDDFSMLVVVPNQLEGLLEMEDKIMKEKNVLDYILKYMKKTQVEITLPKFALHMTVILPSKMEQMNMGKIFKKGPHLSNIAMKWVPNKDDMYISNAVQRIKIWADAGRGAFKDDGYDGDPRPDKIVVANKPYFFMIRQRDLILISGHFAL